MSSQHTGTDRTCHFAPMEGEKMNSDTGREQLKKELDELEKEFRKVTRQAQRSACLDEINARKQARIMDRIEEIEQMLAEVPAQES